MRGAHFAWHMLSEEFPGADDVYRSDTQTLRRSPSMEPNMEGGCTCRQVDIV